MQFSKLKKINWPDHFVSLIVVIVGITIAFYLESYKEKNADKKQEVLYLNSLIADLKDDVKQLDSLKSYNISMWESSHYLTEVMLNNREVNDSLIFHVRRINFNYRFTPQSITYESIKNAGKTDLIRDFDLRLNIIGIYEKAYRFCDLYDQEVDEIIDHYLRPHTYEEIRYQSAVKVNDDFLWDNGYINAVFSIQYILRSRTYSYEITANEVNKLILRMEEYIHNTQ